MEAGERVISAAAVGRVHARYCKEIIMYASALFTQCRVYLMAMSDEKALKRVGCYLGERSDAVLCADMGRKLRLLPCTGYVVAKPGWIDIGGGPKRSKEDHGSRLLGVYIITAYPGVRKLATIYHYNGATHEIGEELFTKDSLKHADTSMIGPLMDLLG